MNPKEAYLELWRYIDEPIYPQQLLQTIAESAEYSYHTALHILHGRFELGEEIISKSAFWGAMYAKYVMGERWEEAEPAISKSPTNIHYYSIAVMNERWYENEELIFNSLYSDSYKDHFKISE